MRICPLDNSKTTCTEHCKYCLEELEEREKPESIIFKIINKEDEKGSDGLWDKAAEIAVRIGLDYKLHHPDKFVGDEPIYAEDFGQEIIYNLLKGEL